MPYSSLDTLGDMRKSPIAGWNAVISRRLGDMRQVMKWGGVPAKPVVKAGTLEREDLTRPSHGSGRDVVFCGEVGDNIAGNLLFCLFLCLFVVRLRCAVCCVLCARGGQRCCSLSY